MLNSTSHYLNCRTNKPNKVVLYWKGRQTTLNGYLYDYGRPLNSIGFPLWTSGYPDLYYSVWNINMNIPVQNFSYGGSWTQNSKYCFGNPTFYPGTITAYENLVTVYPAYYNVTFMCRFFVNQFPNYEEGPTGNYDPFSFLMLNGILDGNFFGLFLEASSTNLYYYSTPYYYYISNLNAYTWYSLAITIRNWTPSYSEVIAYINGQQIYVGGYVDEPYLNYGSILTIFGARDNTDTSRFPFNGYMTDILWVNDIVSSNICYNYSLGANIL